MSDPITVATLEALLQRLLQPVTSMENATGPRDDTDTFDNAPSVDHSQIPNEQLSAVMRILLGLSTNQSTLLTAAVNSASHTPAINIFNVASGGNLTVHMPSHPNNIPTVLKGAEYSENAVPTPAPNPSKKSFCKKIFKRKDVEKHSEVEHPYVHQVQVRNKDQALQSKDMLFDTGADINIISYQDVQDLGLENRINKTSDVPDFRQWNGDTVGLIGTINLAWSFPKGKKQRETFFNVASPKYTNIDVIVLGAKSIYKDEPLKVQVFMGRSMSSTRTRFHQKPAREIGGDGDPSKLAALAEFNRDFDENKKLKEAQKRVAEQRRIAEQEGIAEQRRRSRW
jgi:hypothetical protein